MHAAFSCWEWKLRLFCVASFLQCCICMYSLMSIHSAPGIAELHTACASVQFRIQIISYGQGHKQLFYFFFQQLLRLIIRGINEWSIIKLGNRFKLNSIYYKKFIYVQIFQKSRIVKSLRNVYVNSCLGIPTRIVFDL